MVESAQFKNIPQSINDFIKQKAHAMSLLCNRIISTIYTGVASPTEPPPSYISPILVPPFISLSSIQAAAKSSLLHDLTPSLSMLSGACVRAFLSLIISRLW